MTVKNTMTSFFIDDFASKKSHCNYDLLFLGLGTCHKKSLSWISSGQKSFYHYSNVSQLLVGNQQKVDSSQK